MCLVAIVVNFSPDRIFFYLLEFLSPLRKVLLFAMLLLATSNGRLQRFEDVFDLPKKKLPDGLDRLPNRLASDPELIDLVLLFGAHEFEGRRFANRLGHTPDGRQHC
jgi:hypothetical protein